MMRDGRSMPCAGVPAKDDCRETNVQALMGRLRERRIRLVAYGARLESVLGASPRGFESPILRHVVKSRASGDR